MQRRVFNHSLLAGTALAAGGCCAIRLTDGAGDIDNEQQSSGGNNNAAAQQGAMPPGMIVSYEGPLSGLLNLIGGYYNVNWRFDGGTIVFSRYQTRTFVMDALPGSISMTPPEDTGGENSGLLPRS